MCVCWNAACPWWADRSIRSSNFHFFPPCVCVCVHMNFVCIDTQFDSCWRVIHYRNFFFFGITIEPMWNQRDPPDVNLIQSIDNQKFNKEEKGFFFFWILSRVLPSLFSYMYRADMRQVKACLKHIDKSINHLMVLTLPQLPFSSVLKRHAHTL